MYDCYRPKQAVADFVQWADYAQDVLMKGEFYPSLNKSQLFPDYIALQSGHSRGSTMDLTLVRILCPHTGCCTCSRRVDRCHYLRSRRPRTLLGSRCSPALIN